MPKITEFSWEELKHKTGCSGRDGVDGKSAYQVAVDNGFNGTEPEWLNSLKAAGDTGGLTAEQLQALQAQINGSLLQIAYLTDVTNTTTGSATMLKIASYANNSNKGGGTFIKVPASTALLDGVVITSKDGNRFQRVLPDGFLSWEDCGWVPTDGDSVAFFNKFKGICANVGGKMRMPSNQTVYMYGVMYLDGIKEIDGNGATWRWIYKAEAPTCNLRTAAAVNNYNHGLKVYGLTMDYDEAAVSNTNFTCGGLWMFGPDNVDIHNNTFIGHKLTAVRLRNETPRQTSGGRIYDNRVYMSDPKFSGAYCIEISSDGMAGGDDMTATYNNTHAIKTVPYKGYDVEVYNNHCYGGYYGIVLSQVEKIWVHHNKTRNNTRSIALQNNAMYNRIEFNSLNEFISSAMLCNYGSSYNVYRGNIGYSAVANNQAPIQMNVGGVGNKFEDNHFTVTSSTGARWFIHASVDVKDNVFDGNSYTGPLQLAGISIESSWADTPLAWSYGRNAGTNTTMGSFNASGNKIINNTINSPSSVPAIVLHAVTDNGGAYNVTDTVIKNNEVFGTNHPQMVLFVESGTAKITGTDMGGNRYPQNTPQEKFVMARADMFVNLSKCTNRPKASWETDAVTAAAVPDVTTIDASGGIIDVPATHLAVLTISQPASATQLTKITGGKVNQIIYVRYASGISVKHNSTSLRLIGSVDTPNLDGSKVSTFLCISGSGAVGNNSIWSEITRNF